MACFQCVPLWRSAAPIPFTSSLAVGERAVRAQVTTTVVRDGSMLVSLTSITLSSRPG